MRNRTLGELWTDIQGKERLIWLPHAKYPPLPFVGLESTEMYSYYEKVFAVTKRGGVLVATSSGKEEFYPSTEEWLDHVRYKTAGEKKSWMRFFVRYNRLLKKVSYEHMGKEFAATVEAI